MAAVSRQVRRMTTPSARPRPSVLLLLLLSAMLCCASMAGAQPVDLYVGSAPVASQDEAERVRALGPALQSALVRASGDPTLASDPRLPAVLEQAPRLLQSFGWRQDVGQGADGAPVLRDSLQARFDPAGVQAALASLGRSVWSERPRTLVWLVIDDGSTRRIASAAQVAALGALTGAARERGVDLALPQMDAEDLARLDPDTLWGGPSSAALAAASRYGTPVALVVRLVPSRKRVQRFLTQAAAVVLLMRQALVALVARTQVTARLRVVRQLAQPLIVVAAVVAAATPKTAATAVLVRL